MHASLRPVASLSSDDVAAWDELAAAALEPNPFSEAAFALAAHAHLDPDDGLGVLVACEGSTWHAAVVVGPRNRGRFPFAALTTAHNEYVFLGTPLVRGERSGEAIGALVACLGIDGVPCGLELELVDATGPVARAFGDVGVARLELERVTRAMVRPRDPTTSLVGGRRRRAMGQRRRALAREASDGESREAPTDPANVDETIEQFLVLEASGWKGEAGTALLRRSGDADFFRQWCRALADDDRVRFLAIGPPAAPVAMVSTVWCGDIGFAFKIGVDERWARFSPGVQLIVDIAERYAGGEQRSLDSCADPGNDLMNHLWPDRRDLVTVLIGGRSRRVRAIMGALTHTPPRFRRWLRC